MLSRTLFKGIDRARLANDSRSAASDWFFWWIKQSEKLISIFRRRFFVWHRTCSSWCHPTFHSISINSDFDSAIKLQQHLTLCLSASSSLPFNESKIDCFKRFKQQLPAAWKWEKKRKIDAEKFCFLPTTFVFLFEVVFIAYRTKEKLQNFLCLW